MQDLSEGKITLPIIYLLRTASSNDKRKIKKKLFVNFHEKQEFIDHYLKKYNCIEYAQNRAQEYIHSIQRSLFEMGSFPTRDALFQLAAFALLSSRTREYKQPGMVGRDMAVGLNC